jgi:hypothetical protein
MMDYAELSYFENYAFSHVAAWQDQERLRKITKAWRKELRRSTSRKTSQA